MEANMICENCGKEFDSKRKTAKYCSDKCRKLAFLKAEVSVPKVSVPLTDAVASENAKITITGVSEADRKYLKRYKLKMRMIEDFKNGVVGDGVLKGKKSVPGLTRGKNPWGDLLKTPQDQELLVKVLGNYYG